MDPFQYWKRPRRGSRRSNPDRTQALISTALHIAGELSQPAPTSPRRPIDLARWAELAADAAYWHQHAIHNRQDTGMVKARRVRRYLQALHDAAMAAGWQDKAGKLDSSKAKWKELETIANALFIDPLSKTGGAL